MRFDIDEIFERYKDHIFAIGFNYFKNSIDADDVVQEVFYKLFDQRNCRPFGNQQYGRQHPITPRKKKIKGKTIGGMER